MLNRVENQLFNLGTRIVLTDAVERGIAEKTISYFLTSSGKFLIHHGAEFAKGAFKFESPVGKKTIVVQYVGYIPVEVDVDVKKGETIEIATKYGKVNRCIIWNLISKRDNKFLYSITREDGLDSRGFAKKRQERINGFLENAEKRSLEYYEKSNKTIRKKLQRI